MTKTVEKTTLEKPQHGGQIYQFLRQKYPLSSEFEAFDKILDFSASINPILPSIDWPFVNCVAQKALIHYPDNTQSALKNALASKFTLSPQQITLTNGISSAILSLFSTFKPDTTVLLTPIYSEYVRAAHLYSQHTLEFEVNSLVDLQPAHYAPIFNALTEHSILVLVNPSTPLGLYFTPEDLHELMVYLKQINCWVLVDESFLPFIGFARHLSFRHALSENPKMIILQSLTKYYACPGLRIGSLFSAANALMNLPWTSWPISVLDEQVLLQALEDKQHDERTRQFFNTEKPRFIEQLQACELIQSVSVGSTNFVLVQTLVSAQTLAKTLQEFNILIRDCENFGLGQHSARIAIRSAKENDCFIDAMHQSAQLLRACNDAV